MKNIWNNYLKHSVFLYCVLYTFATLLNSFIYLADGIYEDPSGNWHELDRAVILLIIITAYTLMKYLPVRQFFLKEILVYIPTILLALFYVWLRGLRDTLASTAYRDIFINFTVGYLIVTIIAFIIHLIRKKKQSKEA